MVAAQVQIGRVVTVSLDAGRMEYVVDAQQTFEVAVGVHIAATAGAEAVFEDIGQFGIGVGGWQGVEVTACQYGVGAGNYQLADAVRLFGAFHEVGVQEVMAPCTTSASRRVSLLLASPRSHFRRFWLTLVVCKWLLSRRTVSRPGQCRTACYSWRFAGRK